MAGIKGTTSEADKTAEEKPRRRGKAALVNKVIEKIEAKLDGDELKPTVGDLLRLLQLEKELEDEQPKEIKVSWVGPEKGESEKKPAEKLKKPAKKPVRRKVERNKAALNEEDRSALEKDRV